MAYLFWRQEIFDEADYWWVAKYLNDVAEHDTSSMFHAWFVKLYERIPVTMLYYCRGELWVKAR